MEPAAAEVMPDLASWTEQLAAPFAGRPVIVGFDPLAAMTRKVARLLEWGAQRPLLIARGVGTGPLPSTEDAELLVLDAGVAAMMSEEVRELLAFTRSLPAEVVAAVEAYDPGREAVWWMGPFARDGTLLGRPTFGGRPQAWAALEDKTVVDAMWDDLHIPRAPSAVVAANKGALSNAAGELDAGMGTVWSGDSRDGLNGGADFVRWVRSDAQASAATEFFAARCDRVRVMPFLDGVPCSIHGIVLPDGVAALRPMEMVVLRQPSSGRFAYAGVSTWWDPPPDDREYLRSLARRTGGLLAERVGYRGGFGIDGVLTADGFLPTELNPRFSGGLARIGRALPDLPLDLLQINLVAGREVGVGAAALEELLVNAADDNRGGDAIGVSGAVRLTETHSVDVVFRDGAFSAAPSGVTCWGTISAGPSAIGAFVQLQPGADALAPGDRMAPYAIAALTFADTEWGTGFGQLHAAPDVRGGRSLSPSP
jgi:hypothetical protein